MSGMHNSPECINFLSLCEQAMKTCQKLCELDPMLHCCFAMHNII
jgi:hypothetical protein